jgi:hypothetical protein
MILVRKLAFAGALALAAGATFAGTARADTFWDRLHNQQDRIEQGVDNGSLTRSEARRLEEQERQLARERHRLGENGLSERDREILKRDENRESRRIYDERHDDQRASRDWDDRGGWGWGGDRGRDWRTSDRDDHDHDHHHHHHDNDWNWR